MLQSFGGSRDHANSVFWSLLLVMLGILHLTPATTCAQYPEWSHQGSIAILTTPEGADLPATARVEEFPVLVRLNRETFDFTQARPDGADLRFSAEGKPLAFQIDQWDPKAGEAAIWVRLPVIQGNSRKLITLHWGNAQSTSESNGQAVFNASNGYAVVMHLGDPKSPVADSVGSITPKDQGTTDCVGAIGRARQFAPGQGIACGESISTLPAGFGPSSTEVWLRARQVNGSVVGWGNEQAQGKLVMQVRSPPRIQVDGYFSSGNITGTSRLPFSEWVHVVHTYRKGVAQLYLNGKLDATNKSDGSFLNIRQPSRMWLGGWYGHYQFAGDIDEVRISKVERSANWIKLSYENQKPNQTLVGNLVQPGTEFEVSDEQLVLNEDSSIKVSGKAGGAEKVYWLLQRDNITTIVSADRFAYTLNAGRVTADTKCSLSFKAVYPNVVKTKHIHISIPNTIPEPMVALKAPTVWDGRSTIEVIPEITNRTELAFKRADTLKYRWVVSGGAVIKDVQPDRLILRRSQCSGPIQVTAFVSNGGAESAASTTIQITEPASDPWVQRKPAPNEKPEEGQFYARNDQNEGILYYHGALDQAAQSVFIKVYADDVLFKSDTQNVAADKRYEFAVKLKPGLVKYRVEFGTIEAGQEEVLDKVGNLVCGDAYLIDGQSNALATDTPEDQPRETHEWIRSYGGPTGREDGEAWLRNRMQQVERAGLKRPNLWCSPVWKRKAPEHQAELGWWGMELAKRLVASQKVPVCVIQAAIGGSRIDEHLPSANHTDLKTMYGRMLWRIQQARLTHGIRAVIWHQGENDQGSDGPTGGYGWETYQQFFVDMSAAWKDDLPNIQHYYVFQIWPNSCAMGGQNGSGDRLREAQRTLPRLFSRMSIMSTLGIKPPGGCHFPTTGWAEFARLLQPLIERDFYHGSAEAALSPPNLRKAGFTTAMKDEIALEFDQPVNWDAGLASQFYLDDQPNEVASGSVSSNVLTLKLKHSSKAGKITYLKERNWNQEHLLWGTNGIAALTFCDAPLEPAP